MGRVWFSIILFFLFFTRQSLAEDLTNKLNFLYQNSDGTIELECKHWIGNPNAGDYEVACGKGTPLFKQFTVHVVIRSMLSQNDLTTFEILYWIVDQNRKGQSPAFSSSTQLLTVDRNTKMKKLQFSQGVENDYALLKMSYTP